MTPSAKDIQFRELKDTISQLNTTIRTQNDLILSLQRMLEDRNARDDEKDRIIANLQAQLEYFKQKLFGSSSEKRNDLPGQLNLFSETVSEEEPAPDGHEEIRYTRAKLEHVIYIATTYGCPVCKGEGRPVLIPGSYASS